MKLLNDPDEVADDGYYAFASALWFWMTPQSPKPSCHDIITGYFEPNTYDTQTMGIYDGFGAIINVINGGLECGTGVENYNAEARTNSYVQLCSDFAVPPGDYLTCANMGKFPDEGSSVYNQYWTKSENTN